MSIRRDVTINVGANFALAALGIGSSSFVSYRFGPAGRGVVGVGQVLAALGAGLGCLGIGDALVYSRASGARFSRPRVLRYALLAGSAGGILGLLGGRLLVRWLPAADVGDFVVFCFLASVSTAFFLVPLGIARGGGRFVIWNVARIAGALWWLVSLIVSGIDGHPRLALLGSAYAAGMVAIGLAVMVACREPVEDATSAAPSLRGLLTFGLPAAMATAPLLLNARLDQIVLPTVVTDVQLGHYVAAASYCWAVVPLGQAIANLAATRVAERSGAARKEILRELLGAGVAVMALSGLGAWLIAGWAIPLLNGDGFEPSILVARVLLVGATVQGLTFIYEEGAKGMGRPDVAMRAELTGVIVTAVALVVLVRHGLVAAAVASAIGYLSGFGVAVWSLGRVTESPPATLLRPSLASFRSLLNRLRSRGRKFDNCVDYDHAHLQEEALDGPPDG